MSLYEYERLGDRQIRLFTLLPGGADDALRGEVTVVSIDSLPDYDALSYVWGSPEPVTAIHITAGGFIEIGRNLHLALQHLGQAQIRKPLWIDGICINQSDKIEKQTQIPLMKLIYTNARVVRA
jgi:hypothetical protein